MNTPSDRGIRNPDVPFNHSSSPETLAKCAPPMSGAATGGAHMTAQPAEQHLMCWQDIATAPKDGTEIVVYHPEAGVCAAFCPKEGFAWHCMDGSNTTVGSKSGVSIPRMTSFVKPPTHWMPLPPAPPEPKP